MPAVSCRYPSPISTIFKIEEDEVDRTQSPIAIAAAIQQSDLRSNCGCHGERIAESDGDNSLRSPINSKSANTPSSVTVAFQSTDVRDPKFSDLWEIRSIISMRKANGFVQFLVDWEST
jgi:hypothetical protein